VALPTMKHQGNYFNGARRWNCTENPEGKLFFWLEYPRAIVFDQHWARLAPRLLASRDLRSGAMDQFLVLLILASTIYLKVAAEFCANINTGSSFQSGMLVTDA